ncbi:MAG: hypothetical protein AXA67_06770 [Methylothermaceae bacteria B42]|nr:MAG: hypothetical protein AXA67_06770 [Methylothermaceae bacteria B42]
MVCFEILAGREAGVEPTGASRTESPVNFRSRANAQTGKFGQDFLAEQDCAARKYSRRFSKQTTSLGLNR